MTDHAWMSVASVNPDIMFDLRSDASFSDDEEFRKSYVAACSASARGEPIPAGMLPKTFFAWRGPHDESKPLTRKLAHLTRSDFWFVSAETADVLRRFDLGGCKLHPVEVLMEDRKTPLSGSYSVLDFNSWKDVFLPDQSPEFPSPRGVRGLWQGRNSTPDGAVALSAAALSGADIWWNPKVIGAFFLSDRLVQALRAAGVDKPFSLKRCRIV
ncbi:hypothetical protein [Albidovulum sp.]|uniref:hypothetical protein n=1 Tax=Albidovulum sp. TaxID=1872424 RepID=UPI0039B8BA32